MRGCADDEALALRINAADAGGNRRHDARDVRPVHASRVHHRFDEDRQCGLQAGHAEGAGLPLAVLHLERVGCVVGADAVDGAVGEAFAHRLDILRAAQRRIHLVERIVSSGELLGEQQMVRRGLGCDVHALGLAPAHEVNRARGGQVAHVQARAHVLGEQDVAGDDCFLCDGGPAGQTELTGQCRFVHLCTLGEGRILAVLGDDAAKTLDVLQRAAHENGIGDTLAVVGEDTNLRARTSHRTERGQMLALQALGHRADGADLHPVSLLAQAQHLVDDGGRVLRGRRVRHGVNGGVAADRSSAGAGEDGLGILATGLAQVGMDVNEAGQSNEPLGVDHARVAHTVAGICANGNDRAT